MPLSTSSPGLRIESRFAPLGLHGAVLADGFCDFALELREELLHHPGWSEMTTNAGVRYERQCGITTGPVHADRPAELPRARRFHRELTEAAARLYALFGTAPGRDLIVHVNGMAYGEGAWLLRHADENPQGMERLSYILYLTAPEDGEWSPRDGGALVLSDDGGRRVEVRPRFNRFLLFRNSASSWHEVEPVCRPTTWPGARLALSGWLFT